MLFCPAEKKAVNHTPFTFDEAKKVAKLFIGKGGISQVMVYGSIARSHKGQDLNIIFVVGGDRRFEEFVTLMRLYQYQNCVSKPTRDMRVDAFNAMWGGFYPEWREQFPGHENDLRAYFDPLVLPWGWRNRIEELQNLVCNDDQFLSRIAKDAIVLASD